MKNILLKSVILCLVFVTPFSCTTKKGTTTKLGKFYHNITGRYNAYYNADLLLMQGYEQMNMSYRDNYNKLLAIYPYTEVDNPGMANGSLDEAIKKCAVNIELHRPSNWVDDSYFIIGQAEFLKQEYEKSAATFKFITDKFRPEKSLNEMTPDERKEYEKNKKKAKKKRKKPKSRRAILRRRRKMQKKNAKLKAKAQEEAEKEAEEGEMSDPESYFMKHRPIRNDAMVWYAKSMIEFGDHDEAGTYLRLVTEDMSVRRKTMADAYKAMAHSFIVQKEYEKAIEPIEIALDLYRGKKNKTRLTFILAQLYEKQGNCALAMEYYKKVLRLRPTYEMEFNARLKMATQAACTDGAKMNPEMALRRMLRDTKNEEYKDQIYFALAQIELKNGNTENGILALKQTMNNSPNGSFQRTEAAYQLAEIYYEKEDYVSAFHYYDTTSTSIKKEDERTAYVDNQKDKLQILAQNIEIVVEKDSMLAIADWDYEKQRKLVQKLRLEEAEKKKQAGGGNSLQARGQQQVRGARSATASVNSNSVQTSDFPLYNSNMAKKGERDFNKRWGDRPWADDWRRNTAESFGADSDEFYKKEDKALPPVTEQDVKNYLKKMGVPQNEEEKKVINESIALAKFKIGSEYYEKLDKNNKAVNQFKDLDKKHAGHDNELEAWYMEYSIYKEENKTAQAEAVKQKILDKYGDSDIAKAVKDPNFLSAKEKEVKEANIYYEETYSLIKDGEVEQAKERIEDLPKKFGKDYPMKARFALLAAMIEGGLEGEDAYVKALRVVSTSFPDTEEDKKAKEMVALLTGNSNSNRRNNNQTRPNNPSNNNASTGGKFDKNMDIGHYVIVAFNDTKSSLNDNKIKIVDYNKNSFSLLRLNVSSLMMDGKIPALIVRKFRNGQQAKEYYNTVESNPEFLGANAPAHSIYYINQNNYRTVLQQRVFSEYMTFFKEELLED